MEAMESSLPIGKKEGNVNLDTNSHEKEGRVSPWTGLNPRTHREGLLTTMTPKCTSLPWGALEQLCGSSSREGFLMSIQGMRHTVFGT